MPPMFNIMDNMEGDGSVKEAVNQDVVAYGFCLVVINSTRKWLP